MLTGTRFGVYEIHSLLGAGGMGEVYRARDPKLMREVAIKVLQESLARDLDRLRRFEREAQVLTSLNHPHIGAICGFEQAAGIHALVLDLVEDQTLAQAGALTFTMPSASRGRSSIRAACRSGSRSGSATRAPREHVGPG